LNFQKLLNAILKLLILYVKYNSHILLFIMQLII